MPNDPQADGVIRANELYTLSEVRRRTGLGAAALRSAKRQGLEIKYVSNRGFVSGESLIRFISDHGKPDK